MNDNMVKIRGSAFSVQGGKKPGLKLAVESTVKVSCLFKKKKKKRKEKKERKNESKKKRVE